MRTGNRSRSGRRVAAPTLATSLTVLLLAAVAPHPPAVGAPAPLVNRTLFGAFVGTDPADWTRTMVDDPVMLSAYEASLGAKVQVASYFYGVGDVFPGPVELSFADGGRRAVLLSWHMGDTADRRFTAWSSGRYDSYLRAIGRAAAGFPYPLYVRPWPEMNADWVTFQPTFDGSRPAGGTPAEFVAAWRHVVTTVRQGGGTNVRWVFNPTVDVYPETTDVRTIWPGRAFVDVLGLDGYNFGTYPAWRTFDDLFRTQYDRLTSLDPDRPVWVCEYGSREPTVDDGAPVERGRDKGAWLSAVFASQAYPRLQALVHFDVRKERDWRFASSPSALAVARTALRNRPAPQTRAGLAALGVAGLPPTLRPGPAGRPIVSWGRAVDPGTAGYQVQARTSAGASWTTVGTVASVGTLSWTAPTPASWASVRVRGLDAAGGVRWTSLPWSRS